MHRDQRTLLRRPAMRVCHPGPVALHRSITSTGSRMEISLRGFADRGRPPLFTTARDSPSSVSSGSSLYSCARIEWASTFARSDFKVRREAGFLTMVCLSHAENVARCPSRRVADHHEAASQQPVTDDSRLAVVSTPILDFDRGACEHNRSIIEIQASTGESTRTLRRIKGYAH